VDVRENTTLGNGDVTQELVQLKGLLIFLRGLFVLFSGADWFFDTIMGLWDGHVMALRFLPSSKLRSSVSFHVRRHNVQPGN
jgi:hypothetical protein